MSLLGFDAEELIAFHHNSAEAELAAALRVTMTTRSHYVEQRLPQAAHHGVDQYLILGAGLDSFAYRSPLIEQLQVFEVDHPNTGVKRRRLAEARVTVPAQVQFVAVDFESDPLRDRLIDAGLDLTRPSFVTWLGVTQYLSHDAVAATFATLSNLAAGTELIVEYVLPTEMRDDSGRVLAGRLTAAATALGEPWLTFFSPAEMTALLESCGFSVLEQASQREQVDAVVWRRSDGLHPIELSQLARAAYRLSVRAARRLGRL